MRNKFQYTVALDNIPPQLLRHTSINQTLSHREVSKHILRAKVAQNRTTLLLLAKNAQSYAILTNPHFWAAGHLFAGKAVPRRPQKTTHTALIFGITAEDSITTLEQTLKAQLNGVQQVTRVHNRDKQPLNIVTVHFDNSQHLAEAITKHYIQFHFTLHEICPNTASHMCRRCWQYTHKTQQCPHKQPITPPLTQCLSCKVNDHKTMTVKCPQYRTKTRELCLAMRQMTRREPRPQPPSQSVRDDSYPALPTATPTQARPVRPRVVREDTSSDTDDAASTTHKRKVLLPTPKHPKHRKQPKKPTVRHLSYASVTASLTPNQPATPPRTTPPKTPTSRSAPTANPQTANSPHNNADVYVHSTQQPSGFTHIWNILKTMVKPFIIQYIETNPTSQFTPLLQIIVSLLV